ncbi:tryptophan 5-hydroxylase 1-like [Asterias amurensis]|uniref:tryptophan 5-hydroxylase 1-like n=1 Tax=Asterias amurensis TaxID=7602 RepID=UPI003AB5CD46
MDHYDGCQTTPDYPTNFADLDYCLTRDVYDAVHPSVKGSEDANFLNFRQKCLTATKTYKLGTPVPRMVYPDFQRQTWSKVFTRLTELYPIHACTKFNQLFSPFVEACGIDADHIPDIETVSSYLQRRTSFRLRPVSTFIESRDFLAALAFRVFCCSQFIRHDDASFFTSEPDIVHDVLGHAVLLCDPDFAQFSQDMGLASLGASDTILDKISSIYSSTIEAGLCMEGSDIKAFGALLLSGAAELQHVFADQVIGRPLVAKEAGFMPAIDLSKYQDVYYVAESLGDAQHVARVFVNGLTGRLNLKYNPESNVIERLDAKW